jgi:DNA replication and repair protein RecF
MPALAVRRLSLSHFRSYRWAELGLDARPVALFGSNGAGKTNLVEAVSLLSPGRGLRRADPEELARRPEAIGWKVAAQLDGRDARHDVATWGEDRSRLVEIDGKRAPQGALATVARVLWLVPAMDRLWVGAASERRRFLDRMTMSLVPEHGEAVLGYEKAMRERNRLLRDRVRDTGWYRVLEAQMAGLGAQVAENRVAALEKLGAKLEREVAGFPVPGLVLERDWPEDLAGALREGRAKDLAAGRTLAGPHRDDLGAVYLDKAVPARLCSTGEQKALLISVVLANARAVKDTFGAAPVLILDEVAAHLDVARRDRLYDAVCGLGSQAWLTGTGPGVFQGLGERAQRVRIEERGGASFIEKEA